MTKSMSATKTAGILALALIALAGCGRKNLPVPPSSQGENARPIVVEPDPDGLARGAAIAPPLNDRTVTPREVTTNPNADDKPFILDGLLN